jgi:hypothetical protein
VSAAPLYPCNSNYKEAAGLTFGPLDEVVDSSNHGEDSRAGYGTSQRAFALSEIRPRKPAGQNTDFTSAANSPCILGIAEVVVS